MLIDLPVDKSIAEVVQLFKGSSSNWVNKKQFLEGKFTWGRGYGAFSVSDSHTSRVAGYISNQEEHHKKKSYDEELDDYLRLYMLSNKRKDSMG